ncbi:MAG: hypothetical protein E6835_09465, partial [Lactococcus lactis]|nr:hypothetical protein [Lactococcus lactis]
TERSGNDNFPLRVVLVSLLTKASKKSLERLLSANSHFSLLQVLILLILLAKILSVKIKVTDRNLVCNFFYSP